MKKLMALFAVAAALCLSADNLLAQDNGGDNGGGGGGGGRRGGGRGNFDPAQFQQRMLDRTKEQLGFTNDTDWNAVEPLVQKVMDARRDTMASMFGGFRRGGRGGQDGGGNGGGGAGGGGFGGAPNPDREALQQAIDSSAPAAQVKTALDKYRASQKAKQAKLEQAQADLQKVLSQKQEAQAVLLGLLN
ncbi:MAG TPA: hypothetical protein VH597_12210 [Verrucomicrobiae bacterium]|jgi:hypothetical protein|nr:hypothetical protein [Verrucomicrobiae bacterium]